MSFGEEFLFNATKLADAKSIEGEFRYVGEILRQAVAVASRFTMGQIPEKDVEIYLHGSYANATNTFFPSNIEVCVELHVPEYKHFLSEDYYVAHNLEYAPIDFRNHILRAVNEVMRAHKVECTIDRHCVILPKHGFLKHTVEILPCFTVTMQNPDTAVDYNGVMYYDDRAGYDVATFPRVHQQNGQTKDVMCHGNFKRMVRLFKNLSIINYREFSEYAEMQMHARGYFIECLLFNVPNPLYLADNLHDVFRSVINYLNHANFQNYICQNMIWPLFANAGTGEFWKQKAAAQFVSVMRLLYENFDTTRAELVLG